jgi:RNA polymerase sigma factor (sigma-70 family)
MLAVVSDSLSERTPRETSWSFPDNRIRLRTDLKGTKVKIMKALPDKYLSVSFEDYQSVDDFDVSDSREMQDFGIVLGLARRGDENAWALLFGVYEPGLRKAARDLLGPLLRSEVDIEDLVQSVHWSLWTGLCLGKIEVDSPEALLAIGRTILRRKVARTWRTLERRKRIASQVVNRFGRGDELADVDQSADDPARQISADDQFERLCKIMTRTERRLIELRMLGYTTAEAAREMGRDSESLRVTLARLRKKLKRSGLLSDYPAISPEV